MERERNERARQMRGLFSVELKKGRITGSIVTPTHGGFRRPDLNTVAGSARRIFLCEGARGGGVGCTGTAQIRGMTPPM